jgi:hypothetical protein
MVGRRGIRLILGSGLLQVGKLGFCWGENEMIDVAGSDEHGLGEVRVDAMTFAFSSLY